jgi:hypothetical protein
MPAIPFFSKFNNFNRLLDEHPIPVIKLMGLMTGVLCTLPLLVTSSRLHGSQPVYFSTGFEYSVTASISIAIKMLLDLLVEYLSVYGISSRSFDSRLLLILTLLIPNSILSTNVVRSAVVFQCLWSVTTISRVSAALVYLNQGLSSSKFFNKCILLAGIPYVIAVVFRNNSYFVPGEAGTVLFSLSVIFYFVALVGFFLLSLRWFRHLLKVFEDRNWSCEHICFCLFLLVLQLIIWAATTLQLCTGLELHVEDANFFTAMSYLNLSFVVIVMFLQTRLSAIEIQDIQVIHNHL